jgi:hypothetical protein
MAASVFHTRAGRFFMSRTQDDNPFRDIPQSPFIKHPPVVVHADHVEQEQYSLFPDVFLSGGFLRKVINKPERRPVESALSIVEILEEL